MVDGKGLTFMSFRLQKPSNIGFTASGTCKIFDFGLAREILDGETNLTANTGSLRYMAPEVNLGSKYGLSADVYSFGILLWEVVTLIVPFDGMTTTDHSKYGTSYCLLCNLCEWVVFHHSLVALYHTVVHGGARPKIDKVQGSQDLRFLIQACWHADPRKRPTSTGVRNALLMQLSSTRKRGASTSKMRTEKPNKRKSIGKLRMRLIPQARTRYREVDEQTVLAMNSPLWGN